MKDKNVRHVSDVVGEWGLWQKNITLFSISISLFSALNNLSVSFYAPNINYWCADYANSTDIYNYNLSRQIDDCRNGCNNWGFDTTVFESTIIDEWNLVCDRNRLASVSQSLYMVGYLFGALICGYLSDTYGRLPIIWVTVIMEILAGISSALALNVTHFIISRIILGFSSNGRLLSTFMLTHECVGPKYRATLGMLIQVGWAVGYCLLPAIAYILPHFRHLLLTISLFEIIWLIWLFRIPESPRWQITHNQVRKAELEMAKAVRINGLSLDRIKSFNTLRNNMEEEERKLKVNRESNVFDLLKTPNLRRNTLVLYFTWFVNSFVYYGISLNIGDFGANLFVSFLIAGILEFPSNLFPVLAFRYVGRRPLTAALMYGSGLSCLAVIPFLTMSSVWPRITIALIGKFFITSSYGIIYVYSAEIYPTVVRQAGVGSCSAAARIGSLMAPFVKDLKSLVGMGAVLSIFGTLSIVDGFTIHLLPETRGKELPDTLEEAEHLHRKLIANTEDNEYPLNSNVE